MVARHQEPELALALGQPRGLAAAEVDTGTAAGLLVLAGLELEVAPVDMTGVVEPPSMSYALPYGLSGGLPAVVAVVVVGVWAGVVALAGVVDSSVAEVLDEVVPVVDDISVAAAQ